MHFVRIWGRPPSPPPLADTSVNYASFLTYSLKLGICTMQIVHCTFGCSHWAAPIWYIASLYLCSYIWCCFFCFFSIYFLKIPVRRAFNSPRPGDFETVLFFIFFWDEYFSFISTSKNFESAIVMFWKNVFFQIWSCDKSKDAHWNTELKCWIFFSDI